MSSKKRRYQKKVNVINDYLNDMHVDDICTKHAITLRTLHNLVLLFKEKGKNGLRDGEHGKRRVATHKKILETIIEGKSSPFKTTQKDVKRAKEILIRYSKK